MHQSHPARHRNEIIGSFPNVRYLLHIIFRTPMTYRGVRQLLLYTGNSRVSNLKSWWDGIWKGGEQWLQGHLGSHRGLIPLELADVALARQSLPVPGSNRRFQVLCLYWSSPESGALWCKPKQLKRTICSPFTLKLEDVPLERHSLPVPHPLSLFLS